MLSINPFGGPPTDTNTAPDWNQNVPYVAAPPPVSYVPPPQSTGATSTSQAISAGQQAYSQLPGYAGDIAKVGSNIGSELSGQLPADVTAQLAQQAAERGVSTGSPGSPNSNASYLQALGLTSLQMQQLGQQNLSATLPQLPGAAISQNPSFYVTPALQQQAASQNANAQTEANASAAGLAAAQAGARAGAGGGTLVSGPLPPTPGGDAASTPTTPYYEPPPVVGWGPPGQTLTGGVVTPDATSNAGLAASIAAAYGGTVNPAAANGAGTSYFGDEENAPAEEQTPGVYMGDNYGYDDSAVGNDMSYAG